jgi:hypothetical protein
MVIRFMKNDRKTLDSMGNPWFANGAFDTYSSFYDHLDKVTFLMELKDKISGNDELRLTDYKGLELPKKYERFLNSLVYSHREVFTVNNRELSFSFFHGLPKWDHSLAQQRVLKFSNFQKYLNSKLDQLPLGFGMDGDERNQVFRELGPTSLEDSFVWNRYYSGFFGYSGEIIVHGHNPLVPGLDHSGFNPNKKIESQFRAHPYEFKVPFLFSRSETAGFENLTFGRGRMYPEEAKKHDLGPFNQYTNCLCYRTHSQKGVEAVNIDTGAVYGEALTAMGLSARYLEFGLLPILTVPTSGSNRHEGKKIFMRVLHADNLGAPAEVIPKKEPDSAERDGSRVKKRKLNMDPEIKDQI